MRAHTSSKRRGALIALGIGLAGLALLGVVPAGADGEEGSAASEEPTETTAPPETLPPAETIPPPDSAAPPETTTPPDTTAPPNDELRLPQQNATAALETTEEAGDVVILAVGDPCQGGANNVAESDPRADPGGQCFSGNIGQGNDAAVLAQCNDHFGPGVTDFFNSSTGNSGGNADVFGTIAPHIPEGEHLNVTVSPGVTVLGVFVKAGNGFNAYNGVETDMIGPLVGAQQNIAAISHFVICYSGEPTEEGGNLDIDKVIAGGGTPDPQATFTIEVDCDDNAFDRTLTFDATGALSGGGPLPIANIPLGTICTVNETGQGGADAVTYDPNPPTVTIDTEGGTVTVTVTNTFDAPPRTGGLNVTKSVVGPAPQATTFTITVNCDDDAFDRVLTLDDTGMLTGGGPLPILGIPLGTQCSVTETGDGGADSVTYSPDGGTPADPPNVTISVEGQTVTVTVTNSYDPDGPGEPPFGAISVEKAVAGTPPPDAVYTVRVTCDGTTAILNFGANGGTQTLTGIPIQPGGTSCTVEETGQGGASQVTYSPQDTTFNLTVQSPARVLTVRNVFDPQTIRIGRSGSLPFTGSPTRMLLRIAFSLIAIGSTAMLAVRRRRAAAA